MKWRLINALNSGNDVFLMFYYNLFNNERNWKAGHFVIIKVFNSALEVKFERLKSVLENLPYLHIETNSPKFNQPF